MKSSIALRGSVVAVVALAGGCTGDDAKTYEHGSIKLEFRRGDGVSSDPFVGTQVIYVKLDYQKCLIDFYKEYPGYALNGPDGALAFGTEDDGGEGWKDRLCELSNIDCEVLSFQQNLDDNTGNWLQVTYSVSGPIENRTLHYGPVPLEALAACEPPDLPTVRIANNGAVRGLNGVLPDGSALWDVQKFNPSEAIANQGQSIGLDIESAD